MPHIENAHPFQCLAHRGLPISMNPRETPAKTGVHFLAREHTLGLAAHVEQHGDFLDTTRE